MNQHESRIRDYLSENLKIIEEGMLLVKKEFYIQNNLGAGGFIDILAKDSLGHFTIIEIKRSNEAARAALHELTKYSTLLTSSLGIKIHNIRAILVSTEWHELSTPFSEYLRATNISTIGLVISANQDGEINKVSQFIPQEEVEPLKIERAHQVHLFENKEDREKALNPLSIAAQKASILDFAILTTDYSGGNSTVIHPYGAYFVFSSPVNYQNPKKLKKFIKTSKIPWEDLDDPAENFLCRLGDFTKFNYSSFEIGYPEKLSAMASDGWKVNVAVRQGKYSSNTAVISNDALIREAMQIEGGASADSKLKCNTCQPVRSADAQPLPFQPLQPAAARRPSHHCQPEAAELQRAGHRKATAALTRHHQPGAGAQCSPIGPSIGLWQRQGAASLPAAQALWQARCQAAS